MLTSSILFIIFNILGSSLLFQIISCDHINDRVRNPKASVVTLFEFSTLYTNPSRINLDEYYLADNPDDDTLFIVITLNAGDLYVIYCEGFIDYFYIYEDAGYVTEIESSDCPSTGYLCFAPSTTKDYYIKLEIAQTPLDKKIGIFKAVKLSEAQIETGVSVNFNDDDWGWGLIYFTMLDTSGCTDQGDMVVTHPDIIVVYQRIEANSGDSHNHNGMDVGTVFMEDDMYINSGMGFLAFYQGEGTFKVEVPEPGPGPHTQIYLNNELSAQHLWSGDILSYFIDLSPGNYKIFAINTWDMDIELVYSFDTNFSPIEGLSDNPGFKVSEYLEFSLSISRRVYIRVRSKSGSGYFDLYVSDRDITVNNPNASSSWETDSQNVIQWSSEGILSTVRIRLFKDSTQRTIITDSTANNGSYEWTVPSYLSEDSDYSIRIDVDDFIYDESAFFTITKAIVDDIYEDNDEFYSAVLLPEGKYYGLIAIDEDWYKVNIEANKELIVTINFDHTAGDLDLCLYDSSQNLLLCSQTWENSESVEYITETSGYYYIKVYFEENPSYNIRIQINDVEDDSSTDDGDGSNLLESINGFPIEILIISMTILGIIIVIPLRKKMFE